MTKSRIGWIGLGHMGVPMARNLIAAGYKLALYNRTPGKTDGLDASIASSPADLVRQSDIVITMLSDDASQESVLFGKEGVFSAARTGLTVINMGTVSPQASRSTAQRLGEAGVDVLDAPVSGSVKPAQDGTLVILVGGDTGVLARCQPLFDILGKRTFHFGGHGQGSVAKLAINMMLGMTLEALAESVLFGEAGGLDRATLLEMIGETACASPIVKLKLPGLKSDSYPAAFPLKHMAKDFRLALAESAELRIPAGRATAASFAAAESQGLGDSDVMAVIQSLK